MTTVAYPFPDGLRLVDSPNYSYQYKVHGSNGYIVDVKYEGKHYDNDRKNKIQSRSFILL